MTVGVFQSGSDLFGLPISSVKMVALFAALEPANTKADYCLGQLAGSDDQMKPVIDFARLLNSTPRPFVPLTAHLILCQLSQQETYLAVDRFVDVSEVPLDQLTPPQPGHPWLGKVAGSFPCRWAPGQRAHLLVPNLLIIPERAPEREY